jgi:nickel/cobalt transporter (NiCoT) family protein
VSALAVHSSAARLRGRKGLAALYALLLAANIISWVWAYWLFAPHPALMSLAALAYTFGLRHALDADHIAAIDNVVRKLMEEGRPALSAGFYFALGHSTVVILATLAIALGAGTLTEKLAPYRETANLAGTGISALLLFAIAAANLFILKHLRRKFRQLQHGTKPLERHSDAPAHGNLFLRVLAPLLRAMSRPWHMYPLGFLFGLGFDTATEVGVLGISGTQAIGGLPLLSILVFPTLFAAGMTLADTTDSALMVRVYGWAFTNPLRKLWYNLTVTAASIAAALFVAFVEAAALLSEKLGLEGGFWRFVVDLNANLANFGFAVIGIFIASWLISILLYHRWAAKPAAS